MSREQRLKNSSRKLEDAFLAAQSNLNFDDVDISEAVEYLNSIERACNELRESMRMTQEQARNYVFTI